MTNKATTRKLPVYETVTKIGTNVVFKRTVPFNAPGFIAFMMVTKDKVSLILAMEGIDCGDVMKY